MWERDEKDGVTYDILYDILIKQNGDIHSDWDGTMMDVDAYRRVVFEPYDLKWLHREERRRAPFLKSACAVI